MTADVGNNVQVAGRCTESSAFTFPRDPHSRTCFHSSRNSHFNVFGFWYCALALAKRTRRSSSSGSAAVLTFLRETQTPTGALNLSGAFTGGAHHHRPTDITRAIAT